MKVPWDTRGCYQRARAGKQFTSCAKCNQDYNDWLKKDDIEEKNKILKWTFDKNLVKYNKKKRFKTAGKRLKKPTVEQLPLLIHCNCHQHFFSGYESTCPNKCGDGSCELCNCSCKFVVSTSNYYTVRVASMNARKQPRKSDDINNAQEFLNVAAKIRKNLQRKTQQRPMR
jgi:hypothetical protein